MHRLLVAAILVFLPFLAAYASPAPPLSLPASDGSTFELSRALEEGPVVIVFFRGHW